MDVQNHRYPQASVAMFLHGMTSPFLTSSKRDLVLYWITEKYSHFLEFWNALLLIPSFITHVFSRPVITRIHTERQIAVDYNGCHWVNCKSPTKRISSGLSMIIALFSQWVCMGFDSLHLLNSLHLEDRWTTSRGGEANIPMHQNFLNHIRYQLFHCNLNFNLSGCWKPCPSVWNSC